MNCLVILAGKILEVYKLIILLVAKYTGAAKRCNLENSEKATKSLKGLESQRR